MRDDCGYIVMLLAISDCPGTSHLASEEFSTVVSGRRAIELGVTAAAQQYTNRVTDMAHSHCKWHRVGQLPTGAGFPMLPGSLGLKELKRTRVKIARKKTSRYLKDCSRKARLRRWCISFEACSAWTGPRRKLRFRSCFPTRALTPQIRSVEMIIDHLTARGVIEPVSLYDAPFTGSMPAARPDCAPAMTR
jgi:hypothetical protein